MRLLPLVIIPFIYACTSSEAGSLKAKMSAHEATDKKVLLELFTSQGCSSCPPADKLISSLAKADTNLVVISFHVDYWDRLGWKDVFSNPEYTARQQRYARILHSESVYTPQAVVQGQFEMVGSNQSGIQNAVKKVRENAGALTLSSSSSLHNGIAEVTYKIDEAFPSDCRVVAVLVEKQSSTSVKRGENAGRELTSFHIARAITSVPLMKPEGTLQLTVSPDIRGNESAVIVFLQDNSSGKILAVNQNYL